MCVLQRDRAALRLSIVAIKYLAEKQSVLECWEWDNVAVKLLCSLLKQQESVQLWLCSCPCPASSAHGASFLAFGIFSYRRLGVSL